MADAPVEFAQGDRVRLTTTRRVSYISHPPGESADPKGVWTVAAGVAGDLLLTKGSVAIRIPPSDVQMYMKREQITIDQQLGRILDGGREEGQGSQRPGQREGREK